MIATSDLIEAVPVPIVLVGRTGRLEAVNQSASRLIGRGLEGRHYVTALRQPDALGAVEAALGATGSARPAQGRWTLADETWTLDAAPLPDGSALIAFRDLGERSRADIQRRDFAANVSHELRTPLTALTGFIETLRGPARDDPGARERFLGLMQREAARMDRLISDLLALSRVEGAARVRPSERIALNPAIRRVRETMMSRAGSAGVAIALDLPEGDGPLVRADADQIEQVLTNLVENALKYGAREGGTVRIALTGPAPDPALRGPAVALSVSDDGPGVDPTHLPRLTERFYRADDHRARGEGRGGTGLGLSIVKHIVQRHRGRLALDGGVDEGLRVTAYLPTD